MTLDQPFVLMMYDRHYLVKQWYQEVWLFYLHPTQVWIPSRPIRQEDELETMRARALPDNEAKKYKDFQCVSL